MKAFPLVIRTKPETLAKYGMRPEDFERLLEMQGGTCAVCKRLPPSGRLVVDHYHAKGWKGMSANDRRLHVRGLLCYNDNTHHCRKGITIEKAESIVRYLRDFESLPPLTAPIDNFVL